MSRKFCHFDRLRAYRALGLSVALFAVPAGARADCRLAPGETVVARDAPYSQRLGEMARAMSGGPSTVVFGDSIAGRWPKPLLKAAFGTDVLVLAHGGDKFENTTWTVDQFNPRAAASVRNVLVTAGSNNAREDDECAIGEKSKTMFQHLRARFPSARIYYVNVIQKGPESWPMEQKVLEDNKIAADEAKRFSVTTIDAHTPLVQQCHSNRDCPLFAEDHVHPSPEGFKLMTDVLRASIR